MTSTEEPNLQAFVLFPIAHWDDMMEIVADKFAVETIEQLYPEPESVLFPIFAAADGETAATHRLCCFPTTIPTFKHYRRDLPEWITIECYRIELCVSPREFLATQGMDIMTIPIRQLSMC